MSTRVKTQLKLIAAIALTTYSALAQQGRATVFPQAIALAATWDTELMYRVADIISAAQSRSGTPSMRASPSATW